jgi:hypothetical protein
MHYMKNILLINYCKVSIPCMIVIWGTLLTNLALKYGILTNLSVKFRIK